MAGATSHWVYLLRCGDGTLYCGYAVDVERRVSAHGTPRGARYTRGRGPFTVVARWQYATAGTALRAERRIKALSLKRKQSLTFPSATQAIVSSSTIDVSTIGAG